MNLEAELQSSKVERHPYQETINPERYLSKSELAEKEFEDVTNWREKQYDADVRENPNAELMRNNLETHNGIVRDYALDLIESQGLSPEEKTEAIIATIMHDSGKLASGLLDHHTKGVEYAGKMLGEMMGRSFGGVEITDEVKQKVQEAIERHMNHPFLVKLNKDQNFPLPQDRVDRVVFDADMLANVGFKNVAFRLNEKNLEEDRKKAEENGTTVIEEIFKNVLQGVKQLDKIVLSPEAGEIAEDSIGNAKKIFERLKDKLKGIQDMFSVNGKFDLSTIKAKGGVELLKKLLNEEIEKAGIELNMNIKSIAKLQM